MQTDRTSWTNQILSNFGYKYFFIFLAFEVLSLTAGIAVWMVAHGIYLITSRLAIYWKPARLWILNILRNQDERNLVMPAMTWWKYITLAIYLVGAVGFIYFGILYILHQGFLNQNIIYRIITKKIS
jgi:hypothetical protein